MVNHRHYSSGGLQSQMANAALHYNRFVTCRGVLDSGTSASTSTTGKQPGGAVEEPGG